ncbi:MAG: CBS domain-containing protein [Candidatus Gracilibacteria bacterium]|jgi:CBS domain-containing protein
MLFFSNIRDASVRDSVEEIVGTVFDVLIKVDAEREFPLIIGVLVKDKRSYKFFVPVENIENWGVGEIELTRKLYEAKASAPLGESIVSLRDNVIDKQIVDLSGMRIVRVNDLQFGRVQQSMCLVAIDISTRGILRRIGLRSPFLSRIFKPHFLEWKNVKIMDNRLYLSAGAKEIVKLHPADIANLIEKMNVYHGSTLLQSLEPAVAARVLEEIQPDIKKLLVKSLGTERTAALMSKMSVDELVDLIQLLPGKASREIISRLPLDSKIQKVKRIMEYDEDTAGGLMTTEYITAQKEMTVEQVIAEIKRVSHLHHSVQFVYITDPDGKFLGVVSLRNLIVAIKTQTIKDIMRKPNKKLPTLHVDQTFESVTRLMTKYNLLSVAVLDKEKKLIGVITVDDIMRRLVPTA